MSVNFNASIILGFPVSRYEMTKLRSELNDERLYEKTEYKYFVRLINSYDDYGEFIFVVDKKCSTYLYEEISDSLFTETVEYKEKCDTFHKFFGRRFEKPKMYLVQEARYSAN